MGKIQWLGGGGDLPLRSVQSDPQVRGYSTWDCTVLGTKVCTRVNTVQSDPQVRGYSTWDCTVLGTKVCTRLNTVQSDLQVRGYSKWNCTGLGDETPLFAVPSRSLLKQIRG